MSTNEKDPTDVRVLENGQRQIICTFCGAWKDVESSKVLRAKQDANMARIKALPLDSSERMTYKFKGDSS